MSEVFLTCVILAGFVSGCMCYGVATVELEQNYPDRKKWLWGCRAYPFLSAVALVFALRAVWV